MENKLKEESSIDNDAPLFGKWKGWYWVLALFLLAQIIIYYYITSQLA